jgi:hypothetical protein
MLSDIAASASLVVLRSSQLEIPCNRSDAPDTEASTCLTGDDSPGLLESGNELIVCIFMGDWVATERDGMHGLCRGVGYPPGARLSRACIRVRLNSGTENSDGALCCCACRDASTHSGFTTCLLFNDAVSKREASGAAQCAVLLKRYRCWDHAATVLF